MSQQQRLGRAVYCPGSAHEFEDLINNAASTEELDVLANASMSFPQLDTLHDSTEVATRSTMVPEFCIPYFLDGFMETPF